MRKLFAISYSRILERLGISPQKFPNFQKALSKNSIKPTNQNLLFRIPREHFRKLINTHCPIESLESPHAQEIIKASKLLRHQAKLREVKVCSDCRFMKNCREAKKTLEGVQYDNTLRDLLVFLYGISMLQMGQKYYSKYHLAYKINDHLMQVIDDLSKGGEQFQLFSKTREELINSYASEQKISQKVESPEEEEEDLARRAVEFEKASGLGRDYSFDESSEFDRALLKQQGVQQTKIEATKVQSIAISKENSQHIIRVQQNLEGKAQIGSQNIKQIEGRRRRRSVRIQYIQTDNLKLNLMQKNHEADVQNNHPRFEQLRRKIQLEYQQQQNISPNINRNERESAKSDISPSKAWLKATKQQFPTPRK